MAPSSTVTEKAGLKFFWLGQRPSASVTTTMTDSKICSSPITDRTSFSGNNGDGHIHQCDGPRPACSISPRAFGTGCTFVDYNRDGHLDLFVSNYLEIDLASAPKPSLKPAPSATTKAWPVNCGPQRPAHFPPVPLQKQWRRRTFSDVSQGIGPSPTLRTPTA